MTNQILPLYYCLLNEGWMTFKDAVIQTDFVFSNMLPGAQDIQIIHPESGSQIAKIEPLVKLMNGFGHPALEQAEEHQMVAVFDNSGFGFYNLNSLLEENKPASLEESLKGVYGFFEFVEPASII